MEENNNNKKKKKRERSFVSLAPQFIQTIFNILKRECLSILIQNIYLFS
ncbi:unnamed protein product [Meloidogyne enterolobii]|uniref:Uncharacterized protein n=1 Tax=Meloidogyne enterolobii TaxID=390850 RepID=A0ACB0Y2M0_MELEN